MKLALPFVLFVGEGVVLPPFTLSVPEEKRIAKSMI
jgi:hypothetical protein